MEKKVYKGSSGPYRGHDGIEWLVYEVWKDDLAFRKWQTLEEWQI